jgi:hypothetical protein
VTVVPAHPIVLVATLAGHDLDDLTLAAGLADVPALHDDPVTGVGVHGDLLLRGLASALLIPARRDDGNRLRSAPLEHECNV